MAQTTPGIPFSRRLLPAWHVIRITLVYSVIWYVLTGNDAASWILGLPAVLAAAVVSVLLRPVSFSTVNPAAFLLFVPYFLMLSMMSGIDVLRRTFSRKPRIDPYVFPFQTTLEGSARILLVNVISLLPGTLSADLEEDVIRIHVLDREIPAEENIRRLEGRIAGIFHSRPDTGEQK